MTSESMSRNNSGTTSSEAGAKTGDALHTALTILKRAFSSYGSHNDSSYAAAISYNAIFSIFPILLLLIAFLGFFIHDPAQREQVVNALFNVLGSNVSKDALRSQVSAIAGGSAGLGIVGFIAAAWSANGVFDQLRTGLQVVWGSNKDRPLLQQKLLDFGMLVSIGLLVLLSIASAGVLTALARFGTALVGESLSAGVHALFVAGSIVVPTLLLFFAFTLLYWIVPHAEIKLRLVWPGALLAAIAFELVQLLFAYYVASFGHYAQTYGALGGIIAFLFFVYVASNIVLLGAEVSKEYIDVVSGAKPAVDPPQPKRQQSVIEQAQALAKGLVVDDSPHHDASLPYVPARTEPARPSGRLVTDAESKREGAAAPDGTSAAQRPRPVELVTGARRNAAHSPDRSLPLATASGPNLTAPATLRSWEIAGATVVSLLTLFGGYELLHKLTGFTLRGVESWKASRAAQ
jgi:membrane protein